MSDTATLSAELALNGEVGADDSSQSDLTSAFSIEEASKSWRTDKTPSATKPAVPQQTADSDRPRNPDGTFAKVNADGTPITAPVPSADDTPADDVHDGAADPDGATDEPAKPAEPKLLKLAGDTQRGEPDIELDVTDLPPEVIKRLELNEQRGMRRNEFDQAMKKSATADADRIAFETKLTLDPVGVVMNHMPPERQIQAMAGVMLANWDTVAPMIQTFWGDAEARMRALTDIREGSKTLGSQVSQQITREQSIRAIGRTVDALIPDGIDPITADEFRSAAWTRLNTLNSTGTAVTLESIPSHLTTLAARYGFQADDAGTPAEPPKRPKLAVHTSAQNGSTPAANGTTTIGNTPSLSPQQYQKNLAQKNGARAVAPQGAGGGSPVTRTQGASTDTIEQASAKLRGNPRK